MSAHLARILLHRDLVELGAQAVATSSPAVAPALLRLHPKLDWADVQAALRIAAEALERGGGELAAEAAREQRARSDELRRAAEIGALAVALQWAADTAGVALDHDTVMALFRRRHPDFDSADMIDVVGRASLAIVAAHTELQLAVAPAQGGIQ